MKVIVLIRGDLLARAGKSSDMLKQPLSQGKTALAEVSRRHRTMQSIGRAERHAVDISG
ncbi:hypothetical protein [Alicyclobacillus tolerans]|uniref:Uncharacterized protein n=1 Tax=Alicyclobacillus tolerans TaxID=90970 RepID=A0ABT9LYH1_9BACL|nr:hypothetical protein [Alicyclobacillus tengchongensis]MDP9729310.1 hypothetical protein [Alicyclobacillus tengchongensis]